MSRLMIALAGSLLLPALAAAQQAIPASKLNPVRAAPKSVLIDYITGKRGTTGSALAANIQTIYDNSCAWSGGQFYAGFANCEDAYDEGRIPSTAPGSGSPVSWDAFSFTYCTFNATNFQCNIFFADNAGGPCVGSTAPNPPAWANNPLFKDISLSGLGLPGSTATGFQACWTVTITNLGLCVEADGDGVFDGNLTTDLFTWGFRHSNIDQPAGPEGLLISGDPVLGAPGSCTYNNPCGSPGFLCGTGLDTQDSFWLNVDGNGAGCPGSGLGATNCYFFGGYPTGPFASFQFVMDGGRTCASCTGGNPYCIANPSFDGCIGSMNATGLPSLANPAGFTITTSNAPGQKNGLQFFGLNGANFAPFSNGNLCVSAPLIRLPVVNTAGTGLCDGTLSYTLAQVQTQAANFGTPISAGSTVHQQSWIRDPASTVGSAVSAAYTYTVCP